MENREDEIMFCKFCGAKHSKTAKFCTTCGKSTEDKTNDNTDFNRLMNKIKKITKKQLIIGLSLLLGFAIIASIISYYNSIEYLEKKLSSEMWTASNGDTRYDVKFHLNGEAELQEWSYYDGYGWDYNSPRTPEWELLEDKTLYFDREYYKWKEDWYLIGNQLRIGEYEYSIDDSN